MNKPTYRLPVKPAPDRGLDLRSSLVLGQRLLCLLHLCLEPLCCLRVLCKKCNLLLSCFRMLLLGSLRFGLLERLRPLALLLFVPCLHLLHLVFRLAQLEL